MRNHTQLFAALARSRFRSKFALGPADVSYVRSRQMDELAAHARKFITERLAPAQPANDGRQTPTKGHPVFIAQHAVAACCRSCLAKWHHIDKGRPMTEAQIDAVVDVICTWLRRQLQASDAGISARSNQQPTLFQEPAEPTETRQ